MQDSYSFTLHFGYYNKYSENIGVMNSTSASTTKSHATHVRVPVMHDDGPQDVHVDDIGKECVWRGLHIMQWATKPLQCFEHLNCLLYNY